MVFVVRTGGYDNFELGENHRTVCAFLAQSILCIRFQYRDYPLHYACAKVLPAAHTLLQNGADVARAHPMVNALL